MADTRHTAPLFGEETGSTSPPNIDGSLRVDVVEPSSSISGGRANVNSTRIANSLTQSRTASQHNIAIDVERKGCGSKFCTLMDTWPITFVLGAALIGIGIGIGLSAWEPDDPRTKETAVLWIGLLGELFIRSLKCVVLPLVFVSIAICKFISS